MQNEYNYNADLLRELDKLDLPAAPLSAMNLTAYWQLPAPGCRGARPT